MKRLLLLPLIALLFAGCDPAGSRGPDPQADGHGEAISESPSYRDVEIANAPIPASMHQKNRGGSDGAGLCVIASLVTDGRYQGVGGEVEKLWEAAKLAPGGYYPEKLQKLISDVTPGLKYAQYEGTDLAPLKRWSAEGYPIAATMGTGKIYGYQKIAHYVSVGHIDDDWTGIIDNNNPGFWSWMPTSEYARRFSMSGGQGWATILQYPVGVAAAGGAALIVVAASFFLLAVACRRRFA